MPLAGWAYVGWAALSVTWAIDPGVSQKLLQTLVQLFVVAVLVADVVVHEPRLVRPLLWTYTMSASVTASIGIVGYVTSGGRAAALAGQDPAQFAAILLPALVFSIHELAHARQLPLALLTGGLSALGVLVSGTRGAWLGATVVILLVVIPRLRARGRLAAMVAVGLLLAAMLQVPGLATMVTERTVGAGETGGAGRTEIWMVGLRIAESAPITGVGFGNFYVAYTPSFVRAADLFVSTGYGRGPHSIVIGTLGELGLVGLACLALLIVPLILRRGWGPDAEVIRAILVALMVHALFLDVIGNRKQVWIAIGLAAGLSFLSRRRAGEPAGAAR